MKRCALLVVAAIVVFGTNDSIVFTLPRRPTSMRQPPLVNRRSSVNRLTGLTESSLHLPVSSAGAPSASDWKG
jgi:hypothetical protein